MPPAVRTFVGAMNIPARKGRPARSRQAVFFVGRYPEIDAIAGALASVCRCNSGIVELVVNGLDLREVLIPYGFFYKHTLALLLSCYGPGNHEAWAEELSIPFVSPSFETPIWRLKDAVIHGFEDPEALARCLTAQHLLEQTRN